LQSSSPLKGIRLKVTISGAGAPNLKKLAAEKGLAVEGKGNDLSLVISVSTPEEALVKLGVLSGLLASKT